MDGEAYLRRLSESWLHEIAQQPEETRELVSGMRLREIQAAGAALLAAGAIKSERLAELLRDLRELLVDRGALREVHGSIKFDLGTAIAARRPDAQPPKEWVRAIDRTPPELVQVISVGQDLGTVADGHRLLIISLEVWSDRFGLRYASTGRPERDHRRTLRWEARDDLGTPYRQGSGGGGGGRPWFIFTADLFPGIPTEAHELTLTGKSLGSENGSVTASITLT